MVYFILKKQSFSLSKVEEINNLECKMVTFFVCEEAENA